MAKIETWFNQDLKKAVKVQYIDGNLFSADNNGNIIGVNVYDNGEPATLGGSVSANIIRADGVTVAAIGTLSGNKCSVVLPQSAYSVPGIISIIIKLTSGSDITTVCAVVSNVYTSSTDSVVDPGTIIPSIQTLIDEIEAAIASIPADYSDLMSAIAPTYSNTSVYSVGSYAWYDGKLYRCITDITTAENWTSSHWTLASIGNDVFQYRGDLASSNPITASVKPGVYSSRKIANSEGYPEDMVTNHYCLVEYLLVTSSARHFVVYDVSAWNVWGYNNGVYYKYAKDSAVQAIERILNGNYVPVGSEISFTTTQYKVISYADGSIVSLDPSSEANSHFLVSNQIDVSAGDKIILNISMRYNNGVIAFFNSSNQLLKLVTSESGKSVGNNWYLFTNYVAEAPATSAYCIIGYNNTNASSIKLLTGYTLVDLPFVGKKWACIGDSLTDPTTIRASEKYYDYIMLRTGITFVNLGVSGTGYANDHGGDGTFITRVSSIPNNTDIVTIFGSGNDMSVSLPVGTCDDTTDSTLMGKVYQTIQSVFTNKPKVLLGIISPTPWSIYPPYEAGNKMLEYVTEMEKLCKKYSVPFLDLYHNSNLRPWDATFRANFYSKDEGNGVHPDENGNKRFAPMIEEFIKSILLSN